MNICTIVAKNYVAHARTLAESFTEHHPDGRCFTLIIDDFDETQIKPDEEPFVLVRPSDLDLAAADFDDMRARYNVLEFSTAVKPWLLRWMLDEQDDGSGICYFDPDIRVYSRMEELEAALRESAVVLTPHLTKPMPRDGMKPSETDIMIAGIYNLGFIGLSAGDDTETLIQFWKERLRKDCWVAPERGLFVDQKWIDWIPGLLTDFTILRTPTYNVAYWNVPTREVDGSAADGYTVDGLPLRFFHFSGYGPDRPTLFSKHQNRVALVPGTALAELCEHYGARLLANDFERVRSFPYDHDRLPSGERLDTYLRVLYREGTDAEVISGSIFTTSGELDLVAWVNQAEPAAPGITRYLRELWKQRPDLQSAYPDLEGADREGYLGWCKLYGREQVPISDRMLGLPTTSVTAPSPADPSPAAPSATEPAPASGPAIAAATPRPFGVNVAGYLRSELGIAEVARQMIGALDQATVPLLPQVLLAPNSRQGHRFAVGAITDAPYPLNLVFVNADGLPGFAAEVGDGYFAGRHTIGYWWWELEDFPAAFDESFRFVDEIWAGSQFVADAIARRSPVPVVRMPVPIEVPEPPPLAPGELGWPEDRFSFYFSWDYNSVFKRKNPLAVIEAYRRAFGPDDGAALVLKCINGERDAANHESVRRAIADRPDIVLIDRYVAARDKDRLMATCDCYVSLHRSEGLGLTMAEAMKFGKPVVATNYSGNTDFMDAANSYLVDFTMTAVGEGASPYDAGSTWAEPDVAHAAALMRQVFDEPEERARRSAAAARTIADEYSSAAVAAQLARRLERYRDGGDGRGAPVATVPAIHDSIGRLIDRGSVPRAPSRFGKPGAAARKTLLRTIKPYSAYQGDVNRGLLDRIDRVYDTVAHVTADAHLRQSQDLAELLRELRVQRDEQEQLAQRLSSEVVAREQAFTAVSTHLAALTDRIQRFGAVDELRAIPYMSSDALGVFDDPAVGRVFGYSDAPGEAPTDAEYRAFEDLFRGDEAFIAERQKRYLDLLDASSAPVVDLGCGRGEFLGVLAEAGIEAVGVDSDAGMVARARAAGHTETHEGDLMAFLREQEDGSLGTVFSAQVIEHLPPDVLRELVALARRKLRPGGRFIAETVNPHSIAALKTFWVDVTHQHPLFPEVMVAFCRIAGYSSAYVFHPNGDGDVETDRYTTGEYAVVATV